jgi:tRNA (guanine-N7-)-methyltransferase
MDRRVKPGDDEDRNEDEGRRGAAARPGMSTEQPRGSFFGRRKGKALRPGQRLAVETLLPVLLIDPAKPAPKKLAVLFTVPVEKVRLEIGFGGGEHLLHAALTNPATGFIGVEPFESGLAKAVTAIGKEGIRNIRLYDQDATLVLDWLPPGSIARVDLLFPDPWPKKRHWKRRFVNPANLDRIAHCLEAGGIFRFATDVEGYAEWTRDAVAAHGLLAPSGASTSEPWADWPGTRYEAKASRAGRDAVYFEFRKR